VWCDVVFLLRLAVVRADRFADADAPNDFRKHGQPGFAVAVRLHHFIDQRFAFQTECHHGHLGRIDTQVTAGAHGAQGGDVVDGENEIDLGMDGERVMRDLVGGGETRFGIDGDDILKSRIFGSESFDKAAAAVLRVGLVKGEIQQNYLLQTFFLEILLRPNAQVKPRLIVVDGHDGALVGDLDGFSYDGDIPFPRAVHQQTVKIGIDG